MMPEEFKDIRPYNDDEVRGAIDSLLHDRQFSHILKGFVPFLPVGMSRGILRLATIGIHSTLDFQLRFMKPVVNYVLRRCSTGHSFTHSGITPGSERYTFLSNHRDIVLDSAILDVMLHDDKFPTTCEIAIGDNLLIYPWIRTLVRLNKAFIVQRSLPMREMFRASQTMSRYMHYAIAEKHENIWIAQREGRAKDSSDQTQVSLLKMLAISGEGGTAGAIASIRALNVVPLAISYEFDPCDYLKAQEFQLKRDNPNWKKSKQDDLQNMKTGIFGQKGHVHYQTGHPVNEWIDSLSHLPEKEFFQAVAQRIDREIHQSYRLYPCNLAAADLLASADHLAASAPSSCSAPLSPTSSSPSSPSAFSPSSPSAFSPSSTITPSSTLTPSSAEGSVPSGSSARTASARTASARTASRSTSEQRAAFEAYLQQRIDLAAQGLQAQGVTPDTAFLRERLLTMYANPVLNQERVKREK